MSSPPNPLDKYQSYSYHHFLIASNNTEALRQIESKEISFSSLAGLKHGQSISSPNGGAKVVMVMNSAVDSKFYIENLNYTAMFVNVNDSTAKMTQATELDMIVKETGGATFINFLRKISDEILETSYGSVCFMLKTFFVGHESDGSTTMYDTNPITLIMSNMDSSFDHSGGTHTIKFLGLSNGAPLQNHNIFYVNRNLNLVTSENSILLKDLIADFEKKLNIQLEEQWKYVRDKTGSGRKVKYKFTLPDDWATYTVKSTSKDNYVERLFEKEKQALQADADAQKAKGQQNKPGVEADRYKTTVNTAVKTTVVQILTEIFKHCDQIHEAFVGNQKLTKDNQHLAKLHQIVTGITSDDSVLTVHFDIVNYYLPRLPSDDEAKAIEIKSEQAEKDGFDKFGMTFEYLFTGKNSDILQLDMKANHTNTLLITNQAGVASATSNMTATDKSVQAASKDQDKINDPNKEAENTVRIRKFDAVYLPDNPADAQHGYIFASTESAKLLSKYQQALALLAATSTTNMHIVIRGNPIFMNQLIRPMMSHNDSEYDAQIKRIDEVAKKKATELKGEFDPTKATNFLGESVTNVPLFCKVVIKTPIYDDNGNVESYESFWYQGRYRITTIKNKFANGVFEQDLFLLPYDTKELTT